MPQRLTAQELVFELAQTLYGEVPDVSESLEDDDGCTQVPNFRLLP